MLNNLIFNINSDTLNIEYCVCFHNSRWAHFDPEKYHLEILGTIRVFRKISLSDKFPFYTELIMTIISSQIQAWTTSHTHGKYDLRPCIRQFPCTGDVSDSSDVYSQSCRCTWDGFQIQIWFIFSFTLSSSNNFVAFPGTTTLFCPSLLSQAEHLSLSKWS